MTDRRKTGDAAFESTRRDTSQAYPKFQNEVMYQVKFRSKLKIGGFRVMGCRDLENSSFGPKLSQDSYTIGKEVTDLMIDTKLASRSRYTRLYKTRSQKVTTCKTHLRCGTCFFGYFTQE